MEEYIITISVMGTIDVKVKAASLEEAEKLANAGKYEYDLSDMEIVDEMPVNISENAKCA